MLEFMTAHAHSEVLVGREADLAVLLDALKSTRSAEPSAVLVGGEAGVGKTRLIEEFTRGLPGDQVRVLTGQCLELGEEGLPFAPFAGALRDVLRAEGPAVFAGREREFARLLPELGPPPDFGDARRGLLLESVGELFGRLSERQPVVLVLEDLHWADRSTRDLIGFLVRSARLPGLLLIATYRTDEMHRGHPLRSFLGELDRVRGVQRLELDRLDREGTAQLLTHLLGAEPDPPIVDAVNERAQGNPFFIEQFASSADPACSDIPTNLRDLLLARVDQLPEPAQRVLRVAAVGGTRFGHELLARVAGVDEVALESAMRTIVAAQLVVFDPDGGYEFRHALVREAVHDDLLPGEHARLHARYAQALEDEPHLVTMGRAPTEIAHHWHAAHDHPRALASAKRAADEAARRFAYGEQARLLDRVLVLWEDVPQAAELLGIDHLDLLEQSALVAIDSGDYQRALSLTRAALCDLDAEAEPLRAARLLVRRAKLLRTEGKSDGQAEALEAYRLLAGVETGAERVRLLAEVAYVLVGLDEVRAGVVAQEAVTEATQLGDLSSLVQAEITFARVCFGHMPPTDGLPTMHAAADRARAAGDLSALTRALVNISDAEFELGHYAASAAAAGEGVPHADRVGVGRTTGVFLLANHAEALIALGRWDEADARLAEAARLDPPGKLALPWLRLRGMLRLARGHEGAAAMIARAVALMGKPFLHTEERFCLLELRILLALAAGDTTAAVAAARAVVAELSLEERPRYAWATLTAAARAATGLDDLQQSIRAAALRVPRRYPAELAQAATLTALLDGTTAGWSAAVEAWRLDGQPYELARALLGLAEARAAGLAEARAAGLGEARTAGLGSARNAVLGDARAVGSAEVRAVGSGDMRAAGSAEDRAVGSAEAARPSEARAVGSAEVRAVRSGDMRAAGSAEDLAVGSAEAARPSEARAADRAAAAAALTEATALADTLGATPLLEAADTLARRLGVRPSTGAQPVAIGAEILTAREREVLRLVAEGQSNSRIAESLYISPKTASVHVSRIIAKLEVANRVEAAAVARRLGLLAD